MVIGQIVALCIAAGAMGAAWHLNRAERSLHVRIFKLQREYWSAFSRGMNDDWKKLGEDQIQRWGKERETLSNCIASLSGVLLWMAAEAERHAPGNERIRQCAAYSRVAAATAGAGTSEGLSALNEYREASPLGVVGAA